MILIDDRKGSAELIREKSLREISELTRLDFGDVMFTGNGKDGEVLSVGIEVKSVRDMVSSIATGRLQSTQIPGMQKLYDVSWILIHGEYRCGPQGQLQIVRRGKWWTCPIGRRPAPYGYLESFLCTLAGMGMLVKTVHDMSQSAHWIACLHRWYQKPHDKHRGMHTFDHSKDIVRKPWMTEAFYRRAKVASALPGLGFERAVKAAQHFKSINQMMSATPEDWVQIPGIGKSIAKTIVMAIREWESGK